VQSKIKTIGVTAIWLLLAAGLFLYFDGRYHPNTAERLGSQAEVVLKRDLSGHYRAEAIINGMTASVMVDTGATEVSVSRRLADKLGIQSNAAVTMHTANGDTVAYMTRLASIRLGGIEANDVAAMISPNLDGDVLLGMSFLNRMDVRLYKGTMTIRKVTD